MEPQVFSDERGYNLEAYHAGSFREAGLDMVFVQDNLSMSAKGTLRGRHFQKNYQQGKLVCVVSGEVFDAVVDIRDGSRTYGQWFGTVLSAEKKNMLYVPEGFAHGFYVTSEIAVVCFKVSDYWHPNDEIGIPWDDWELNINWPIKENEMPIVADKDLHYDSFSLLKEKLIKREE